LEEKRYSIKRIHKNNKLLKSIFFNPIFGSKTVQENIILEQVKVIDNKRRVSKNSHKVFYKTNIEDKDGEKYEFFS
jgi:hypothetical protein